MPGTDCYIEKQDSDNHIFPVLRRLNFGIQALAALGLCCLSVVLLATLLWLEYIGTSRLICLKI